MKTYSAVLVYGQKAVIEYTQYLLASQAYKKNYSIIQNAKLRGASGNFERDYTNLIACAFT